MGDDPRQAAARYRLDRAAREQGGTDEDAPGAASTSRADPGQGSGADTGESRGDAQPERGTTAAEPAAYVETAVQQAIRRGDFDDLPGAGRPLEGLTDTHDPDWWIRRKIRNEKITGLGPPALALRVEHAEMSERLDALGREGDVHEAVADFNRRVIEARRQLQGGPPVVTPTLDVDGEVRAWRERRAARIARTATPDDEPRRRRRRWRVGGAR